MHDSVLRAIETAVLETALDPGRWPDVLGTVAGECGAFGAVMIPVRGRVPGIPTTPNLQEVNDAYFRDGWSARDRRDAGFPKLFRTGLMVEQDYVSEAEMARDPFWQEFLSPFDLRWSCVLKVEAGEDVWCLSIQRTVAQGPFTAAEQAGLGRLVAPLGRASTFVRRLDEARLADVADALETVGCAAVLLDRTGRATRLNERARSLLGRTIDASRGSLAVTGHAAATAALRRHVEATLFADVEPGSDALRPVAVPRADGRPLLAQAQALRGAVGSCFAPARALLTLVDPDDAPLPSRDALRALFGFTGAETRLAEALARAGGLPGAAKRLGVSYDTARGQLKAVFAKTGAANQAELLALLARLART